MLITPGNPGSTGEPSALPQSQTCKDYHNPKGIKPGYYIQYEMCAEQRSWLQFEIKEDNISSVCVPSACVIDNRIVQYLNLAILQGSNDKIGVYHTQKYMAYEHESISQKKLLLVYEFARRSL